MNRINELIHAVFCGSVLYRNVVVVVVVAGGRVRESADPGVQERTVAAYRRNDAQDVSQQTAQLRPHAHLQEVRGQQLHRKAGEHVLLVLLLLVLLLRLVLLLLVGGGCWH